MVRVLFFAQLREALGPGENLHWSSRMSTVAHLRDEFILRGGAWRILGTTRNLRVAVNQTMVEFDTALTDGDEVAFFPPVTGG